MGFDTKPNLSNNKFEQCATDIMTLSGCTEVHGILEVENNGILQIQPDGTVDNSGTTGYNISGTSFLRAGVDTTAIELGQSAVASKLNNIAIGNNSSATADNSAIAIGVLTCASGDCSIAIGISSLTCGIDSISIGRSSKATSSASVSIGSISCATGVNGVAIGISSIATTNCSVAIGRGSYVGGNCGVALGASTNAGGAASLSIGFIANSGGFSAVAIGNATQAPGSSSVAIGRNTDACGGYSVGIGGKSYSITTSSISIGGCSHALGVESLAIGWRSVSTGASSQALGSCAYAIGSDSIAIGCNSKSCFTNTIAIGTSSNSVLTNGIAMGYRSSSLNHHDVAVGNNSCVNSFSGVAVGAFSVVTGSSGTAIGSSNIVGGSRSSAFGSNVETYGACNTVIGFAVRNDVPNSVGFGWCNINQSPDITILFAQNGDSFLSGSSAQLAIGHDTPTAKIDLSGASACTSFRMRDGSEGAGKILTSDADGYGTWEGASVSSSGENIIKEITQTSHGFALKDVIGWSGGTYNKAIADGTYSGESIGIIQEVVDVNTFKLAQSGWITGLTGLVADTTYFLSTSVSGGLQTTEPTTDGHISNPIMIGISATEAIVFPYRGQIISTGDTSLSSSDASIEGFDIVGDDTTTGFTIVHNFGTRDVVVNVWEAQSPYEKIVVDTKLTSTNSVDVEFAVAPATGEDYRVIIIY